MSRTNTKSKTKPPRQRLSLSASPVALRAAVTAPRAPRRGKAVDTIESTWARFRVLVDSSTGAESKPEREALRNRLIEHYLPLVKSAAERKRQRLPAEVEVDDLMSAGLFGLMNALDHFDPGRGVKFETYCTPRINGAIIDELRSMDWVPRLVRARAAKVDRTRKAMEMQMGRKPTDDELCKQLGLPREEFEKVVRDARPVGLTSLNRKYFETDSSKDVREIDVISDGRQEDPFKLVQRGDLQALLTKGLSRSERLILILYYYEEMTMKEIGMTLDLSESRVSQMHSSIIARLKAQMQHRLKDPDEVS